MRVGNNYSLRPKPIVLIHEFFFVPKQLSYYLNHSVPKRLSCFYMILSVICFILKKTFDIGLLDIRGSNSNVVENESHHQEDFRHRDFQGCSGAVGVFYFECHTYNHSYNGERTLILPKLEIKTIIMGRREYMKPFGTFNRT